MINKSLFIKKDVRKIVSVSQKGKKSLLKIKIYDYNEKSKKMIFEIYENKNKLGLDSFELTIEELRLVFNVFTDYLFDIDDLSEILENPNITFEQIFHEIEMILADLVILFVQEQEKKLADMRIKDAVADMQQMLADGMKDIQESNPVEVVEE